MTAMLAERPPQPRDEHRRIEALHEMLLGYNDARAEASSAGGGGSRLEARMLGFDPTTWTAAYVELDRCLQQLRYLAQHGRPMIERGVSSGAAWWAVRERYLNCEIVLRYVGTTRSKHGRHRNLKDLPRNEELVARETFLHGDRVQVRVRRWHPDVDPRVVQAGLRWLSAEMRCEPRAWSVA